jgi:hypothetical protein
MRYKIFTFLALLITAFAGAQQLNCTVTVNSNSIANANTTTFKTLERSLAEFVNKTDWTGTEYNQGEKIECSMYITLNSYDSNNYAATIQVQAARPVYGSTYSSPIFNYNDKDLTFTYVEFQNLTYDPTSYSSNLVSVVSFYAYMILGIDGDTFAPQGGTQWLETAQEICNVAQQGGSKGWTQSDGNQNRYFLVNDMLSATFSPFREAMYQYHFEGLDVMHKDQKTAKQKIGESIQTLAKIYNVRPNAFLTRVFFDAKSDELVSIFSGGPAITVADLSDNLNKLSPLNSGKWNQIKF